MTFCLGFLVRVRYSLGMRFRIIDLALLIIAVTGFGMTLSVLGERSRLNTEFENYVAQVGRLKVEDPEKVYIKHLATDIHDHFAWRVYLPPPNNRSVASRVFNGDDSRGGSFTNPHWDTGKEETIRVTLRHTDNGVAACLRSGGLSRIKDERISQFISQHWDDLQFEIVAEEDTLVQAGDEVIKLLGVSLPKELADEFVAEHGEEFRAAIERPFTFYHGYEGAKGWP